MNAPRKTTVNASRNAASLAFAESYIDEAEASKSARIAAQQIGVPALSSGSAAFLTFLARLINAKACVEIGTGTGVSSLALLSGMVPDGVLTSIDIEAEHQAAARRILASEKIPNRRARLISGPALTVLPRLSDGAYDLVFVDGDPLEFPEYIAQALRLLRSGGLLIVNHALWQDKIATSANEEDETLIIREALDAVKTDENLTAAMLPIGDGLVVAVKK